MEIKINQKTESGFALLMSLIVVGVLISMGLSVLELSIKQVRLSTNARDSEIAFHAANAGMECGRYWRRAEANAMETGSQITVQCFNQPQITVTAQSLDGSITAGSGEAFLYTYEFTWGTGGDRCTQITALIASSSITSAVDLVIDSIPTYVPGYTDGNTKECEPGGRCTIMSVRGYNRPCNAITNYGTVQREVLLQF